jgi:cytochrome b pre-mRNA-processing protein 3
VFRLIKRRRWGETARALYEAAVGQARRPEFYTRLGVSDTVDGRFDMIALHVALLVRRLTGEGRGGRDLAQVLFDTFFRDMDRSLREMGVGDLGVGTHVKGMAKAFYGRAVAYEAGLSDGRPALEDALRRNLYRKAEPAAGQVAAMAAYVEAQAAALAARSFDQVVAEGPAFGGPPAAAAGPLEQTLEGARQ